MTSEHRPAARGGRDTHSFQEALRRVLRQAPDVILVGELRDLETIHLAITAAETGHLVFGTLHTTDAVQTVDRAIDVFPPNQQAQIRMQLSVTLLAIICQQLLPTADGKGRVAAFEIMVATPAIRSLIGRKTHQLPTGSVRRRAGNAVAHSLAQLLQWGKVKYRRLQVQQPARLNSAFKLQAEGTLVPASNAGRPPRLRPAPVPARSHPGVGTGGLLPPRPRPCPLPGRRIACHPLSFVTQGIEIVDRKARWKAISSSLWTGRVERPEVRAPAHRASSAI